MVFLPIVGEKSGFSFIGGDHFAAIKHKWRDRYVEISAETLGKRSQRITLVKVLGKSILISGI